MPEVVISDVSVEFPHPNPYGVQRTYMEKVIECLKDGKNGVLESPTGTGKTLSLLCACLAWQKKLKDEAEALQPPTNSEPRNGQNVLFDEPPNGMATQIPKIIYASRTHTQLTQVINELKGTAYSNVQVGVLASREQLCIHPELAFENNETKTEKCQTKIKKKKPDHELGAFTEQLECECSYFEQYKTVQKNETFRAANFYGKILDVEDLRTNGLDHGYCPFYMARTLVDDADIVFMPYNYLLDPMIRHSIKVELSNAVIILDEAHNVPQVCEDSASVEFKSTHFTDAIAEVKKIARFATDNLTNRELRPSTFDVSELDALEQILIRFKRAIDDIPLSRTGNVNSIEAAEFDGDYIFTIMENADIGYHTSRNIIDLITNALEYVSDCIEELRSKESREANLSQESQGPNRSGVKLSTQNPGLRKFKNILWMTFPTGGEDFRDEIKKHYRVYAAYDRSPVMHPNGRIKVINYWCFSPKFGLQSLIKKNVRSIIFTSGTMSPLQPFITSLGISIEVQLQNGHIIDSSQVLVEIVSHGPDSGELLSNFKNRSEPRYLNSMGSTVLKFCEIIPNGLLIFFPSYTALHECKRKWQNEGIWSRIESIKPIFVEPKFKKEFTDTMQNYYRQINDKEMNGAIFMAVCRGKVSEGLDFADINGRAVIVTGLPLAPCFDPKVRLKKGYMQRNYTTASESLSGDDWYYLEASRAVNQAIGRVIRHRRDYGAILLCDSRFGSPVEKGRLSHWVQRHIRSDSSRRSFDAITSSISEFFRNQPTESSPVEITSQSNGPSDGTPQSVSDTSALQDNGIHSVATVEVTNQSNVPANGTFQIVLHPSALQDNGMHSVPTNGSYHSVNLQRAPPESPMTSFTRQLASLPLTSPSLSAGNTSVSLPPSTSHSNGTPNKLKCMVNLSEKFNQQQ